ncbi:hypothetical protein HCMJ_13 [Vibrio phage vB_VpaS_HCMJ]|uniref:Uncharacterized protein n=1 Tax=Vibrio phage vB_VpaS_HCMJ TaxID=2601627 RepID=A0A5C2IEB6_9CAUD|nr:hypothetical protein HCMJ_13 [Vibrio phage vB_VpaS_HCMJ]
MDNVMLHPMPITYRRPEQQRHAVQLTKNNVGTVIQALVHLDVLENLVMGEETTDPGFGRRERVTKPCITFTPKKAFYKQFPDRYNSIDDGEVAIFEDEYLVLFGNGDFQVMSAQEFEATYKWGQDEPAPLSPCAAPAQDDLASIAGDREFSEPRVAALEPEVAIAVEEEMEDLAEPIEEPEEYGIEEREESPRAKRMAKRNRRD